MPSEHDIALLAAISLHRIIHLAHAVLVLTQFEHKMIV